MCLKVLASKYSHGSKPALHARLSGNQMHDNSVPGAPPELMLWANKMKNKSYLETNKRSDKDFVEHHSEIMPIMFIDSAVITR